MTDDEIDERAANEGRAIPPSRAPRRGPDRPIPLDDLGDLPAFPIECLPSPLREWVLAESEATQTPRELAALTSLAALSSVAHPDIEIQIKQGWREPVALWSVVTMASGERKSAVVNDATRPISCIEEKANESFDSQALAHDSALRILKSKQTKAEKAAAAGKVSTQEAQALAVESGEHEANRPKRKRYFTADSTPEALAHLMADQKGKCALFSSEGSSIFGMLAGRYSDNPNLEIYLKGHAGETVRVDRRNAEPLTIDHAVLSMGLTVQPDVLEGLAANSEFRGTGLLARFLYTIPKSMVGSRATNPSPVPQAVSDKYAALFQRIADRGPEVLAFDHEALAEMDRIRTELEPRLGEYGDLNLIADWGSKLPGAIARVAGIFALIQGYSVICVDCVHRGKILIPYLTDHSLAAFGMMGADPAKAKAKTLIKWFKRRRITKFSKRDAHKDNRAQFKKADELDEPLEMLEEYGWIRSEDDSVKQTAGRPPSPTFNVHPSLAAQNAQNAQNAPGHR